MTRCELCGADARKGWPRLCEACFKRPVSAPLAPLPAQLDLDGGAHEIAPHTERMRLFEPAPSQLAGQTYIDTDEGSTDAD